MRIKNEDSTNRLKKKVKNRQSRKHIYQVLKTKTDNWKKIKNKTEPNSLEDTTKILKLKIEDRKNCQLTNLKSFKSKSKTLYKAYTNASCLH